MRGVIARWALLTVIVGSAHAAGCSDPAARVQLVPIRPIADGTCGRPAGATELRVIAYARTGEIVRAVPLDGTLEIADFPADTEQLGVEVRIGGGQVGAAGKTAPLVFGELASGTTLPVFMAPPDGFCPTGAMIEARTAPLVARAGDGVLIVGGLGADGRPLATAERYDPATATFTSVPVPAVLGENGFVGASLTPLPDGRVVVSGGPQPVATIYDPETHAFADSVLIEGRAFHVAIATGEREVLLAGGCSAVEAGACSGVVRLSSKFYDATDANTVRERVPGPALRAGRLGARIFELGVQRDGRPTYVAAGGLPPANGMPALDAADRFALGDLDATAIFGSRAQAVALDGGAVLTAFAPDGDPADGTASVLPAEGGNARVIARAPDVAGARLVTLEDGRVLGIGDAVVRYDPMLDAWDAIAPAGDGPGPTTAPVLHRLDDGSVLVLGGTQGGAPVAQAWIYRPSLIGPATGALTVVPTGVARANVLTPSDPATVTRGADWVLAAGGADLARALVGGPRMRAGTLRVVARVRAGGIALVAQQVAPGRATVGELAPGMPARIRVLEAGEPGTSCGGATVAPFDPAVAATLELVIEDERAQLRRDGVVVVSCDVRGDRGAWGVAALGAGAEVAVDTVTVGR